MLKAEILSLNAYKLCLNVERNNDVRIKMRKWIKRKAKIIEMVTDVSHSLQKHLYAALYSQEVY